MTLNIVCPRWSVINALYAGIIFTIGAFTETSQAQQVQGVRPNLSLAAAMAAALSGNSGVLLARTQEDSAKGSSQTARGLFDITLNAKVGETRTHTPLKQVTRDTILAAGQDFHYDQTNVTIAQVEASKLFKNGLQASLLASHTATTSNLNSFTGQPRQSIGALAFQLQIPLLRNSGNIGFASLNAANLKTLAAREDLEFTVSKIVLRSALAYWDYLAKTQRLVIAYNSERRGKKSLDELRKLIAADETPRAEINLGQASQNDRRGTRIAAEQALLVSRQKLGRVLGLNAEAAMLINELADAFPKINSLTIDFVARKEVIIARALEVRSDLLSLRKSHEAAQILLDAAHENERAQLDLVLGVTQSGLAESKSPSTFGPGFGQNYGQGYSGHLVFKMPLQNNAALGLIRQKKAKLHAQRVMVNELEYEISSTIVTSTYAMVHAVEQLKEANLAVKTYAMGLENERTKRRLGLSTLIDILNVEDRYNNALLSAVQARQAYASAIAQFLFSTGMLVLRQGEFYTAPIAQLLNPSAINARLLMEDTR